MFFHPLASYPGPLLYRGSELPRLIQEWRGNTVHKWAELHEKYGPVVRIAPGQLSYINTEAWRDIYGSRTRSSYSSEKDQTLKMSQPQEMLKDELEFPGDDFEFFAPAKPMISCDAANHARHRRAVGPAFSERALRSYESLLIRHVDAMMQRLGKFSAESARINIVDWFNFTTFDITSALVFGKAFGCLADGSYHPWVARVFPGMKLIARSLVVTTVPGLGRVISWFIPKFVVEEARGHMNNIVDMVEARRTSVPEQKDFMSYILPHISTSGEANTWLSTEELYLNSQLLVIAGSETTATLMSGAVYLLSRNPRVSNSLTSILRASFESEDQITPASACHVPLLTAVINESLRLYPPGAINMPRTVPPGGALIDGHYVPGGTVVGIAQFAAYRSSRHFAEPLTFAPERWLGAGEGATVYARDNRDMFKPFSFGTRNCVGQNLAMLELKLILARLLWRFDVRVLPGQESWIRQRTFLSWEKPRLMCRLEQGGPAKE